MWRQQSSQINAGFTLETSAGSILPHLKWCLYKEKCQTPERLQCSVFSMPEHLFCCEREKKKTQHTVKALKRHFFKIGFRNESEIWGDVAILASYAVYLWLELHTFEYQASETRNKINLN